MKSTAHDSRPIITLCTDFGDSDGYVAAMKAVILSVCPNATLVDISHRVPPQDVSRASLQLLDVLPYFSAGTVHLVVVDPGVGSQRKGVVARVAGQFVVAPDNGLTWPLAELDSAIAWRELAHPRGQLARLSNTFHGRDWFAPSAALLASGVPFEEFGDPLDPVRLELAGCERTSRGLRGEVLYADHFGNLITSIVAADLPTDAGLAIRCGGEELTGLARTYSDGEQGKLLALLGSSQRLEVAVVGGSAARRLNAGHGDEVEVLFAPVPESLERS